MISSKKLDALVAAACVIGCALLGASFGQDAGFDLKNYHWYAGWQLVGGRLDVDVAPAQIQGYFNPLVHLPLWFGTQVFGERGAALLLGGLHGLGPYFAWRIGRRLFDTPGLAAACALVGFVGPIELVSLGTSSGDALMPVFVLAALGLLLDPPTRGRLVASGVLVGIAVGLKPTVAMYAIGIGCALLVAPPRGDRRVLLPWAAGVVGAFAVVAGPWMLNLLVRYGNPVFPLANHIFDSPWAVDFSYSEDRLMPSSAVEAWLFPLRFAQGGTHGWEVPFRDARVLVTAGLAIPAMVWSRREVRFLFVSLGVAYVIWQLGSSVYRYLGVVELLAPTLVAGALVGRSPRAGAVAAALALLAAIGLSVQVPNLTRVPFGTGALPPFGVRIPAPPPPGSVVLIAGADALSYLGPALGPDVRLVRPWSSLSTHTDPTETNRRIAGILEEASGPLYLLEGPNPTAAPEVLDHYGLEVRTCRPVATRLDSDVTLCELAR